MFPIGITIKLSLFEQDLRHISRMADSARTSISEVIEDLIVQAVAMDEAREENAISLSDNIPPLIDPTTFMTNGASDIEGDAKPNTTADGIDASH